MASFKNNFDTGHLRSHYFQRVTVFLESEEDYLIVRDRWFYDEGEFLDFRSSDEGEGGGAKKVISNVNKSREQGFVTFGLVDRDALFAECRWDHWWEVDDERFHASRPLGEHIRILKRWEIENYLLDPEIIEEERANIEGRAMNRTDPAGKLSNDVLEAARLLASAAIVLHENGIKLGDDLDRVESVDVLQQKIAQKVEPHVSRLDETKNQIDRFGEDHPANSARHWERISRMLDGKRILKRLNLAQKSLSNPKDYRLSLASKIRQTGKIDTELVGYIGEFKSAAGRV